MKKSHRVSVLAVFSIVLAQWGAGHAAAQSASEEPSSVHPDTYPYGEVTAFARTSPKLNPSLLLAPSVSASSMWQQEEPPATAPDEAAAAEDETVPDLPDGDKNPWRFTFESQWWLPTSISGPLTVGPTRTDLTLWLGTLLEDLKFIIEGGITLTNDQWSLLVWGLYMNVGTDVVTNRPILGEFDTRLNFAAVMVNMMGAYRIGDWALGSSETMTWGVDVTTGLMLWDMDMQLNEATPGSGFGPGLDEHDTWVDWMVGGRIRFKFTDQLSAMVRGEVGGFGIGNSADLDWNITLLAEYRIHEHFGLVLGYRYLQIDWSEGSGLSRIGYDWRISGAIVGVNIHF